METATKSYALLAEELFLDVKRVLETDEATTSSFENEHLRSITNWEEQFGCYFSHVLYFNLGG